MDGLNNQQPMPPAIAKVYWQAYASWDSVDDPRLKRALFAVMSAVHQEVLPTLRPSAEDTETYSIIGE